MDGFKSDRMNIKLCYEKNIKARKRRVNENSGKGYWKTLEMEGNFLKERK